jgi:choline dehydrogenase-like flavoprotein
MNPQSRGSITLASSDPADAPLIDFGFMNSSYDRNALTTAIRHAMQFRKTKVMSKYWKKAISVPNSESDEDIWVCCPLTSLISGAPVRSSKSNAYTMPK